MGRRRPFLLLACLACLTVTAARAADEPDEDMPGHLVFIRPGAQLFKFVSKAATDFALPAASNDPTVEGGSLFVFDSGGAVVSTTFPLPASGWKSLGTPPRRYRYRGTGSPTDPCRIVLVRNRVVKAVCKGSGMTLVTPFAGQVGIVVTLGTDSKQYCVRFGGDETRNDSGLLKRGDAPAQTGSCPSPGFACPSPGAACGSCSAGFCSAHVDPDAPPNLCANSAVCAPGACTSDADCSDGRFCVQNPFPPGETVCCSPCP